jgi:hypothetical protein
MKEKQRNAKTGLGIIKVDRIMSCSSQDPIRL